MNLIAEKTFKEKSIYDFNDICFDFEVFKNYWCVTFLEYDSHKQKIINKTTFQSDINDNQKTYDQIDNLYRYVLNKLKDNVFIAWNVNYDKNILYTLLFEYYKYYYHHREQFNQSNINLKLFEMSQALVNDDIHDFINWNSIKGLDNIIFYDAMKYLTIPKSLKASGGEAGFSMLESNVPWDKEINETDIKEIVYYNQHDVDILFRMLLKHYDAYEIKKDLVNEFTPNNFNYLEYKNNAFFNKIYNLKKEDKLKDIPEYFNFYNEINTRPELYKIKNLVSIIENKPDLESPIREILNILKTDNIPTADNIKYEILLENSPFNNSNKRYVGELFNMKAVFGLGGIHGSQDIITNEKTFTKDVISYYPNGFINLNLQSRAIKESDKHLLNDLKMKRVEYKKSPDITLRKKEKAYKIIINANYGLTRSNIANIQDPVNGTILCIIGQLLLLYLCDLLKEHIDVFIQINTDGIEYIPKTDALNDIERICQQWESETEFLLETETYKKVFNFNVNNYVMEDINGKIKSKGRYLNQYYTDILTKSAMPLFYDLHILSKLIINLLVKNQSFNQTIQENPELWKYATIKKITNNYDYLIKLTDKKVIDLSSYGANKILEVDDYEIIKTKSNRFFATKNGYMFKKYAEKKTFDNVEIKTDKEIIKVNKEIVLLKSISKKGITLLSNKIYQGEKFADAPERAYIYNEPLFNNYENNYDFKPGDIKTLQDFERETNQVIDIDWYKNRAIDYLRNYENLYEDIKNIIPNFEELVR